MYTEDYDILEEFRLNNNLSKIRTLDAQIIELADDIAYAVHDLEDALSQRYFTTDEILYEMNVIDEYTNNFDAEDRKEAVKKMTNIIGNAKKKANLSSSYHNLQEYSQVFRKAITSYLTDYLISDIELGTITAEEAIEHGTQQGGKELKLGKSKSLCQILSKKIFKGISRQPTITLYEERGAVVIESLFKIYTDIKINDNGKLLPPDYRPIIKNDDTQIVKEQKYAQAAANYIAGMMDTFAIETYENLFATPFSSICILPTENKLGSKNTVTKLI